MLFMRFLHSISSCGMIWLKLVKHGRTDAVLLGSMTVDDPEETEEEECSDPEDNLQELCDAPRGHIGINFDLRHERGAVQVILKQEISSQAEKMNCQIRCLDRKIKAVFDFIDSLPPVFFSWALGRRKASVVHSEDFEEGGDLQNLQPKAETDASQAQASPASEAKEAPIPSSPSSPPSPRSQASQASPSGRRPPGSPKPGSKRRAAVVTLTNAEAIEEARRKALEAYLVEVNRLQSSLTPLVIRDICRHIYDNVVVENPPWNLRIGSVEAVAVLVRRFK